MNRTHVHFHTQLKIFLRWTCPENSYLKNPTWLVCNTDKSLVKNVFIMNLCCSLHTLIIKYWVKLMTHLSVFRNGKKNICSANNIPHSTLNIITNKQVWWHFENVVKCCKPLCFYVWRFSKGLFRRNCDSMWFEKFVELQTMGTKFWVYKCIFQQRREL